MKAYASGERPPETESTIQEKFLRMEFWCIWYVNQIQDIHAMISDAARMTLQNTIFELLSSYLGKGYKVYMDNYFNSVALAKLLHE
jgi:hypothetical protein